MSLVRLDGPIFTSNNTSTVANARLILPKFSKVNDNLVSIPTQYLNSKIKVACPLAQVNIASGTKCWVTPMGDVYGVVSTES
jgi:hypothetical protein